MATFLPPRPTGPAVPPLHAVPGRLPVEGVLGGRAAAFCVDFVVVSMLVSVLFVVLLGLGFLTFGLPWLLIPSLFPMTALIYNGVTVSGRRRGTWGMRLFGIELRTLDGGTPSFLAAALHAVFLYVSVYALTPLVLACGLFRDDRRLLHDLLAGVIAVRRGS